MDITPRPPSPPTRRSQPRPSQNQPPHVDGGSRPNVPSSSQNNTGIHKIECWVYDYAEPTRTSSGTIVKDEIAAWLREPSPSSFENRPPVAGLRLICLKQRVSMAKPFDEPTFRAVNLVLGLPKSHTYLTTLNAGACGKYHTAAGQPGEPTAISIEAPIDVRG